MFLAGTRASTPPRTWPGGAGCCVGAASGWQGLMNAVGFLIGAVARPLAAWAPNLLCLYFRAFPVWVLADALVMNWRQDGLSLHDLLCGTRVVEAERRAS